MSSTAIDFDSLFAQHGAAYTAPKRSSYRKPDQRKKFAENIAKAVQNLDKPDFVGGKPHDSFTRLPNGRIVAVAPRYGTHRISVAGVELREFASAQEAKAFFQLVAQANDAGHFDQQLAAASSRKSRNTSA